MKKLLIIFSYILLATACQQNDEEYITQTTELSALDQFSSNLEKQNPNISNSSTRANQALGGFIVNILWDINLTFSERTLKVFLGVPHQTALNYLESLANSYPSTLFQPVRIVYYGTESGYAKIGLQTLNGYVASEMFIKVLLRDFASLMIQAPSVGLSFDFEFDVDYPEWPPVTGDTIT